MKKVLLSIAFLLGFVSAPVFSNDQGVVFDLGVTGIIKFYTYEQVSYVYNWDSNISLGVDFRVMNNLKRFNNDAEPYCYFQPGLYMSYDNVYVSFGPVFYDKMKNISDTGIYGRMGYRSTPWNLGIGRLGLDGAVEMSTTFYKIPEEGENTSFGDVIAEIANLTKVTAGVMWYLPF